MVDLNKAIRMAVDTGKVVLGVNESLKLALSGKGKLFIIADNCPKETVENMSYYAEISKLEILKYSGDGIILGQACGKPFNVSLLAILEPGDSKILELIKNR